MIALETIISEKKNERVIRSTVVPKLRGKNIFVTCNFYQYNKIIIIISQKSITVHEHKIINLKIFFYYLGSNVLLTFKKNPDDNWKAFDKLKIILKNLTPIIVPKFWMTANLLSVIFFIYTIETKLNNITQIDDSAWITTL